MKIKILLADDHTIMQEGLRSLLLKEPDMEVIAEAQDGRTAVGLARELTPDVVIMDISMRYLNGIDATRQIVSEMPGVRVVALSMHGDEQLVAAMLQAGACGYLLKSCIAEELVRAVRAAVSGQTFLSPSVTSIVAKGFVRSKVEPCPFESAVLTTREREVLQLLTEGMASKKIAGMLHVSLRTVQSHRQQIMDKLGMHTVPELTKYAIRNGLTSLEH